MIFSEKCMTCARRGTGTSLCDICGLYPDGRRENYKAKKMTNADRLREMDDDELASWLCFEAICPPDVFYGECAARDIKGLNCHDCWLRWLRKEEDL